MSFGGLLAYEVATKLAQEGGEVGLLAIFDTINPAYYQNLPLARSIRFAIDSIAVRLQKYVRSVRRGDIAAIGNYVREFFARKVASFRWHAVGRISRAMGRPMPKAVRDNVRASDAIGNAYAPKLFSGRLTLFRAEDRTAEYRHEPTLGWDAVVQGGVDVLVVRGDHITIMEKPNVVSLVNRLNALLNRSDATKKTSSDLTSLQPETGANRAEGSRETAANVDNCRADSLMSAQ